MLVIQNSCFDFLLQPTTSFRSYNLLVTIMIGTSPMGVVFDLHLSVSGVQRTLSDEVESAGPTLFVIDELLPYFVDTTTKL